MKITRWIPVGMLLLVAFAACSGEYIPEGDVVHTADEAVFDKKGSFHNLDLLDFKWRYLPQTDQIRLWGWVQNMSGETLQGARIVIEAYDQFDQSLGTGEAFLNPTFLDPEQRAEFDMYFHRGHWIEHMYLVYRFETRS